MTFSQSSHFISGIFFGQPVFVAFLSSSLCAMGLAFLAEKSKVNIRGARIAGSSEHGKMLALGGSRKVLLYSSMSAFAVSAFVLLITNSLIITAPFTIFSVVITVTMLANIARRKAAMISQVWPEVTDHLISGIHSGLSLTEALIGLGTRGPELVRPYFLQFHSEILSSGDFVAAAEKLKRRLNSHGSDQILEAILLAKSLGGSELLQIFRTLGDFLRQDLALRKEVEIKHGWIKNSAHLSAAAPWLLLLLLSSQPGTAESFAQPGGVVILIVGLTLTGLAYLWMGRLGQLPSPPRVFE
jgi:tight adherence protein B